MRAPLRRVRGFTFLEMAVVLFTTGFLFMAVPRLVSQSGEVLASQPGATPAEQARLALTGFILRHHRLPCPAASSGGGEDCSLKTGYLPYQALGLSKPLTNRFGNDFWYGVHADLTGASGVYNPTYKDSGASYWQTSSELGNHEVNLLDFCAKLRTAAQAAPDGAKVSLKNSLAPAAGPVNVAWALADPGPADADRDGRLFDLGNHNAAAPMAFESTGRTQSSDYDDTVSAAGLNQLFGELRCPGLLAATSAAAREADFANENWRTTAFLYDFRAFEHGVRIKKKDMADNMLLLAYFDISLTVSMSALDLGVAIASASGAVSIAINAINAITGIAMSVSNLQDAQQGVADAQDEVVEGAQREADALAARGSALTFRDERRAALLELDGRGGFQ